MPCPSRVFPDSAIPREGVHYLTRPFKGRVERLQMGTGAALRLLPPENATGNSVKVVQRAGENRVRRAARSGPCAGPGYVRGARGERAMTTATPANIALTGPSAQPDASGAAGWTGDAIPGSLPSRPPFRASRAIVRQPQARHMCQRLMRLQPCRHDCRPRRKKLRAISSMIKWCTIFFAVARATLAYESDKRRQGDVGA